MGLNDTIKRMRELLGGISVDLEKSVGGNKAASQRVRTSTIRLEKVAKNYRKESISSEKSGGSKKSAAKKAPAKSKASSKPQAKAQAKPQAKQASKPQAKASKPQAKAHAKPQAKAKAKASPAKKPMMMKRPTAKLPVKKA